MAGVLVGGAFLSGFINVVLDRLISADAVNFVVGKKLSPDLVERLRNALIDAGALVDDAELKQLDNPDVKEWLNSLRDAIYTADDLLDRVCTKAATQKGVRTFLPTIFNSEDRQMVNEIERVVRRIEDLEKRKGKLGLEKISTASFSWKTPSSSLVRGDVFGREDDQKALVQMLNDNNENHLSVISIVGIGGVGKTTLAQWMYNNADLMEGFDPKAWVCISENFNVMEATKNILKEVSANTQGLESFNSIQDALKQRLSGKKFFIVLDDVWSNDHHQWKDFLAPFQYGAKGSAILLTTRIENVGSVFQTNYHPHYLNPLSEDYCWSVFAANASFPESNGSPTLERIGKKIAKKCDGLPLAAETLGCLCRKHDAEEWETILRSNIWGFSTNDSKIIPALLISYFHLPAHLKRCFVYCSLFPKDHQFEKDELVLLWMAEDLLRLSNRKETLEDVGSKYFDDLASRLFLKKVQGRYGDEYFAMHDLLHDLAMFLAGDFYCRLEELGEEDELRILTRHLSHFTSESFDHPISKVFNSIVKLESLRTWLYINDLLSMECIASKFKYLRVLSIQSENLDVLPDSIGELIHLRYLMLSWMDINRLPESLYNLYNLQTLILCACTKLTRLPGGIQNLVSLRHLLLWSTSLEEMPGGISKLKHMHTLNYFVVGKHEDNGIQALGELSNLHGSFKIMKLENVVDVKQARSARIMDKKNIDDLWFEWSSSGDDTVSNTQTERDILDSLKPHHGLKELRMEGYKGTIFPDWLGNCSYQNMTSVSLKSCKNCCMLPSLGQLPSLKSLRIEGFDQLKIVGMEFYKNEGDNHSSCITPFPSLETLEFKNLPCWEVWHACDSKAFPQLSSVEIEDCPMLKGDMLIQVFLRIFSSLSNVSKVRKLSLMSADGYPQKMFLQGDTLSIFVDECKAMDIKHLNCLEEIEISLYSSPMSLSSDCLPKSLQELDTVGVTLQQEQKYDFVKRLRCCYSPLTWLSLDAFPNLKTLNLTWCSNLESVSMSKPPHAALQSLTIHGCNKFVSFPGERLHAPNLTHLDVRFCHNLEVLPHDMNTLLPNLHSLNIEGCENMCRLPEGGLPPNLKELTVGGCDEQLMDLSWMGNLESLTHLNIDGGCDRIIKSCPEVGWLPHLPSLTTLCMTDFFYLETLESSQLLCLTSLQHLIIEFAYVLKNISGEKLPSTLIKLELRRCDLMPELCRQKHGEIWPKICHIPTIQVDGQQIV